MIYLKDGLHRRPCFRSNVDQYTKPSQIKKFKVARKRAMTQRKCYSASILSIKNRRKIIIYSRDIAGSFCYSLAKSNVFAPLTPLRGVQRKTLLPRAMGCTPFLAHHGPKNSLRFSAHKVDSKKIGANKRTEKIASSNFCLPIFCQQNNFNCVKIISKKWSSPFARISVRFVREPRRQKKRELITPSLRHLINLITVFIAFHSNCLLFTFEPQQAMMSIWS